MAPTLKEKFQTLTQVRCQTPELISYRTLRRSVGILGVSLPFILVGGSFLIGACRVFEPSISHYYYTNMREIFVGVLCAVALFLFTYKGHTRLDSWISNIAGFFSLGIALFPTDILPSYSCQYSVISFIGWKYQSKIHITSAALFFLTLSYMSVFLFTKSDKPKSQRGQKKNIRNRIYVICGIVMTLSILIIAIYFGVKDDSTENQTVLSLKQFHCGLLGYRGW